MVFTSTIFMFIFLPLVVTLYFLIRKDQRNTLLLIASLLFYAWGEPKHILVMLASIGINYYFGILIHKYWENSKKKKNIVIWSVVCNLSLLIFFKYANFIVDNINSFIGLTGVSKGIDLATIHLPIGISFFTFQGLSYVIDVYRGDVEVQKSIYDLALYISFFPQLIAGPIVRYHDIDEQIKERKITIDKVCYGIKRFIMGFAKKVLIANQIGLIADKIFAITPKEISTSLIWIGAICYTLQIYFDFSGYSDMAIGLGKIFGFDFLENFNYPYISKSIREFWKRWHISLTNWFRDYVYIPLGGNRKGVARCYVNQIIVFLLSGLWHGASWNFIFWGAYHGAFLVVERTKVGGVLKKVPKPFRYVYALLVVTVGWVIFRADTLTNAFAYIKKMFVFKASTNVYYPALYLDNKVIFILILAIVFSTPILRYINSFAKGLLKKHERTYDFISNTICILVLIVSLIALAGSTYNPFIYFRF
ncbi:MBOAT family O-acyltransferase [Hathewaya limosa]|uniref:Alginate O-acetyltransferase complex protein AlgI n=2 Tax=Hathewaya limosa TaxID=1536 RepID=A0ABU0JSS2_HATLI|nr:alginate O-acetyltransferase complex protein AlgI [Hathewaya limosa]